MLIAMIAMALVVLAGAACWVAFKVGTRPDPEDSDWYQGPDGAAWYDPSERDRD